MEPRITTPAQTIPGALDALLKLAKASQKADIPMTTHYLMHLRASQINGCAVCVDMHSRELKLAGEPDNRIHLVAAWREAPYYSDAERAALALTEADDPPRRPSRPRLRRGLGRGRQALRRGPARLAGALDLLDQRLEPHQRRRRARSPATGSTS